jgi:hypothetical protein
VHPVGFYCTGIPNTRWWRVVLAFGVKKGREGQTKEKYYTIIVPTKCTSFY